MNGTCQSVKVICYCLNVNINCLNVICHCQTVKLQSVNVKCNCWNVKYNCVNVFCHCTNVKRLCNDGTCSSLGTKDRCLALQNHCLPVSYKFSLVGATRPVEYSRQRAGLGVVGGFEKRPPGTVAKFIIKCSLLLQKFKVACPAETEDRLCF